MENLWLLPDSQQSGEIKVLNEAGQKVPVSESQDIPLSELPSSFVLGVPESVLKDHPDEAFIYSQFARLLKSRRSVFACSMRAGKDKTGRTVHLTNLQILAEDEQPTTDPRVNKNCDKLMVDHMTRMVIYLKDDKISLNTCKMLKEIKANKANGYIKNFFSENPGASARGRGWWPDKNKKKLYVTVLIFLAAIVFLVKKL